jgi:hypothetical protein
MGRTIVVVGVIACLTGCSAFMTRPPRDPRPGQWIVCSDTYRAPATDTGAAVIGIGGGIASWILVDDGTSNDGIQMTDDGFDTTELFVKTAAVVAIIGGLAYAFSAAAGYDSASRCNKMKAKYPRGYGASLSRTQPDSARL